MAPPVEPRDDIAEQFQEVLAIGSILMDCLTPITTRRHVLQRTGKFQSDGSGHGLSVLDDT